MILCIKSCTHIVALFSFYATNQHNLNFFRPIAILSTYLQSLIFYIIYYIPIDYPFTFYHSLFIPKVVLSVIVGAGSVKCWVCWPLPFSLVGPSLNLTPAGVWIPLLQKIMITRFVPERKFNWHIETVLLTSVSLIVKVNFCSDSACISSHTPRLLPFYHFIRTKRNLFFA